MHEASEMDDLYVGHCLWCGKPYLPAKGKKYIQRFCSVQCRNSYYRNEDKDALNRAADKDADNRILRDTISRQEETIEYESAELRKTDRENSMLRNTIRTLADDLSELMGAGVLVINRRSPSVRMLNQHDSFLRIMEDWSSKNRSTIEKQHTHIERIRQRWHEQRDKAIAQRRSAEWIRDLDQDYQSRLKDLMSQYTQYATYLALDDMKNDHRQQTGTELPLDGTEAEPLRMALRDFAQKQGKERTKNHDISQQRPGDSQAAPADRGAQGGSEGPGQGEGPARPEGEPDDP
ncbi:MAG: hypothetical protein M3036_04050 [Bifidobacteriales bacterium]|nr:hypothetical protein [Bifidobacteriales bacterium]